MLQLPAILLLNTACREAAPPSEVLSLSAEASEAVATVVLAEWETAEPVRTRVDFRADGEDWQHTPLEEEASTSHEAVLLGLPGDTLAEYRVTMQDEDGELWPGEIHEVQTGVLPLGLPGLRVEGESDHVLAVSILGATTAATIIDAKGRIIWYRLDSRGLDVYRVRLSRDGRSVLYNAASVSGDPAEDSMLVRVSLDGSEEETIPVPLLAHDFVEHADGTLAALSAEYRDFEGTEIMGNQLVELAPDGTQQTVWSAWDCFDPAADGDPYATEGWTFANALDYDEAEQAYYVGFRALSSIAKIDRATGECLWVFGREGADISFAPGSASFLHQHQFHVLDDGILVFDNDGAQGNDSRVLEYTVDFAAGVATERWSYNATPALYTFVLGDVHRFGDGGTLVNWSVAGQIDRLDAEGESAWRLNSDLGYAFGFGAVVER